MSVAPARSDYLTFIAGLNTEGGYFTQPSNTWKEGDNVVPNIDGSLSRRLRIDFEDNYTLSTSSSTAIVASTSAYYVGYWKNVNGQAGLTYYVVQIGRYVYFYTNEGTSIGLNNTGLSIDLSTYRVVTSTSTVGSERIQCESIEGNLLIVGADIRPLFVSLPSGSLVVTPLTLKIRDFEGLDDGLAINERPSTLSVEHNYNLLNQGWDTTKINAYKAAKGVYPSSSQSWIYGKDASGNFDSNVLDQLDFGSSSSPKGRYILDLFNQDRSTASGVAGITTVATEYRPTTCCFFAGRAWYSGIAGTKIGSYVLFSHLGYKPADYAECYQIADPTSEILSDLVESDGGVVPIKDALNIQLIVPMFDGIIVFAENGVWQIKGSGQAGFSATGYSVYKLSNIGCVSAESVIQIESEAYYWSNGGIYKLQQDPTTGNVISVPVTDLNIKTLYVAIPSIAKTFSKGTFNNSTKRIVWSYNNNLTNTNSFRYSKTHFIEFDLRLGAFFTWSVSSAIGALPIMVSQFVTDIYAPTTSVGNVIDSTLQQVVTSTGDTVTVDTQDLSTYTEMEKYLTLTTQDSGANYKIVFADRETTANVPAKFRDWYSLDGVGVGYTSYFVTGFDVSQSGPNVKKYSTYCTTYMKRTETAFDIDGRPVNPSSCKMQARWDFSDSDVSNKWTSEQEIYRHRRPFFSTPSTTFNDGHPLVVAKNKIRGSGKAIQFKFSSYGDNDMRMVGWQAVLINVGNV